MRIPLFILSTFFILSCKQKTESNTHNIYSPATQMETEQNESELTIAEIDSLNADGMLTKKFYPNMSFCGGALNGFYYKGKLVLIDATYSGELSYTRTKIYLSKSDFSKIIYQEHFPEMTKYKKEYPFEKYDFDPGKITFSDTIYQIDLGKNIDFKKTYKNRVLSTKIDSVLIKTLIDCGMRMKKELESITG